MMTATRASLLAPILQHDEESPGCSFSLFHVILAALVASVPAAPLLAELPSTGTDTVGKPNERPATASQLAWSGLDAQASIPNHQADR